MNIARTIDLIPIDIADDDALGRWVAVHQAVGTRPLTSASLRAELTVAAEHAQWIATLDGVDAGVVGVGWSQASLDSGVAFFELVVAPDARRRGVGAALADRSVAFARECGLHTARTMVIEGDDGSLRFATSRGLEVVGGGQEGFLDLTPAHAEQHPTLPPAVEITSFAERPDLERAIYDLEMRVYPEIPTLALEPLPSYEAWQAQTAQDPGLLGDLCLLAIRDDRLIGLLLMYDNAEGVAYIGMAAVEPEARRLGIARALKVELAARAARAGWRRIETFNDGTNERMRALNLDLGYVYRPRQISLKGPLPA